MAIAYITAGLSSACWNSLLSCMNSSSSCFTLCANASCSWWQVGHAYKRLHAGPPPNLEEGEKKRFKNYAIFVTMHISRKTPQPNESFHNGPLLIVVLHVSSWILITYLWTISTSSYYNIQKSQNNNVKATSYAVL
jgi:hypothetical protein